MKALAGETSRLLSVAGSAGIVIEFDDDLPTACATMRSGKYVIKLGRLYKSANEQQRATLLAHEIAHILRGDLLVVKDKSIDSKVWNVSADAHINYGLRQNDVVALQGVTYDGLKEKYEKLPREIPGTLRLYDLLKEEQQGDDDSSQDVESSQGEGGGSSSGACQPHDELDAGDGSVGESEHAKTVLRARAEAARQGVSLGEVSRVVQQVVSPKQWAPPNRLSKIIEAVGAAARSCRGALARDRSYSRPGRVEGLRGVIRRPRIKVLLAIDASGSMSEWVPYAQSAARALRKSVDASVAVWAESCKLIRGTESIADAISEVGFGTDPECIIGAAKGHDVVVVITDGQFYRTSASRLEDSARVVWLIVSGGTRSNVRGRVIEE